MFFLWYNTATAESELPPCQGEDHMQWTNCFGSYLKKDLKRDGLTRDYTGEFGSSPGMREGKGTGASYKNGNLFSTFDGEYKNDKLIRGTITWPSGQKYVGELKDGKINGQGTFTWPSGQKYVGGFKDGKRNGQGTHTWPNGDKEVAVYKDGEIVKIVSSNVKKESSGGSKTLTGYTYITMMDKGIADNGIWGTRCNYSDGSYREIKSSDPGGPPPRC